MIEIQLFEVCVVPQAKKFSLPVHLWVKLQATKLTFRMPWSRTCLPDQGLTGLVSASLRHFLTVRHSSSTKIFILPPCSSHSALIWCLGTHIPQLVGAWQLLHSIAGHQPSSPLAEIGFCTSTNSILKIKRIRYRLIFTRLHPRTSTVLHPFYCELVFFLFLNLKRGIK